MPDAEQQVCTHRVFAAIVIKTGIATGSSGLSSCTVSGSSEASQVAQQENNPPAVQETQETRVQSLGREDPLEEGTATHFRILARRVPWTEEPGRGRYDPWGPKEWETTKVTKHAGADEVQWQRALLPMQET